MLGAAFSLGLSQFNYDQMDDILSSYGPYIIDNDK